MSHILPRLLLFAFVILGPLPAAADDRSSAEDISGQCAQTSECTVVRGFCGGWLGINKIYAAEYEAAANNYRKVSDCEWMPGVGEVKPNVTCEQSWCTIQTK